MKRLYTKTIFLIPLLFCPPLSRGAVIFSNVTGAGSVNGYANICGSAHGCLPDGYSQGEQFKPSDAFKTYDMTDAQVLVGTNNGDPTFDVYLYADDGGSPGALIEQIGFALAATTADPGSLVTANTIGTPVTLVSGTPYWLVLGPHLSTSRIDWELGGFSNPGVPSTISDDGRQTWFRLGSSNMQFQIDATPTSAAVPEPSSFAFMLGAAVVSLLWRKLWADAHQ